MVLPVCPTHHKRPLIDAVHTCTSEAPTPCFSRTFAAVKTPPEAITAIFGGAQVLSFNPLSILIGISFGTVGTKVSGVIGGGTAGDLLAAPINVTCQANDSGTKPPGEKKIT